MNTTVLALVVALASGEASASGATATVHIKNFAFTPAKMTVPAGTVVRFVNDDGEAHTITAENHSFDSTGVDGGDTWSYRFAKPGTFAYFCALHPYMKGAVVVVPAGTSK